MVPVFKVSGRLLVIGVFLFAASDLSAGTCFAPFYYEKMFTPYPLDATAEGDTRLVGESDHLAAKGKDPHGEGCMCGLNRGRWDMVLRNTSQEDERRVPTSFRIEKIEIIFEEKSGPRSEHVVQIDPSRFNACFATPIPRPGYHPFNAQGGHFDTPETIEPGEAVIGCLCVAKEDRIRTGLAMIRTTYHPMVWMGDLSDVAIQKAVHDVAALKGEYPVMDLSRGNGRYFKFTVPEAGDPIADLRVTLTKSSNADLYYRMIGRGWSWDQNDWKKGDLKAARLGSGQGYWFLIRARGESGRGTLAFSYRIGSIPTRNPPGSEKMKFGGFEVGGPLTRSFKAHVLSMKQTGVDACAAQPPSRACCGSE